MASDRFSVEPRWTALLLAGSRPGVDVFAAANGVRLKALIPVGGEPMLLRPLRALLQTHAIEAVNVMTTDVTEIAAIISVDERARVVRSKRTIAATLAAVLRDPEARYPLLVTTADHALLTADMINEFITASSGADLAIGVVEKRRLEARLPQSRRTWIGFKGGRYSGANLFAIRSPAAARAIALWAAVEQDRKKGWRMLFAFGLPLLIGAGLRLWTIDQSLARIGRRLRLNLRAVVMSDPLAAVDVDKPADLVLVEAIVAGNA